MGQHGTPSGCTAGQQPGAGPVLPVTNIRTNTRRRTEPVCNPGCWPRLMRAKRAAAYVDERSVEAFRRGIPKLYPAPIKVPGKGERWLKEALDTAIDRLTGKTRVTDIADQL